MILSKIKQNSLIINEYIKENLKKENNNLWNASKHYITAGGKRLRPFMVIKCLELLNNDNTKAISVALPVASAIELLHTYTLVHDDIMDNDDIRRGVQSIHTKWGEPIAILAGDLLYGMSIIFTSKAEISDKLKSEIMLELGKVDVELCEGQTMDIEFEKRFDVTVKEYMEMIRLKTSALFSTCAHIGGLLGGADNNQLLSLKKYGENLGLAFQIVDDILGLIGDQNKLGKPIGSDLREGKKTFLLLYALENLEEDEKILLKEIINQSNKSDDEINQALLLIKKSGAIERAKEIASSHIIEAKNNLKLFLNSEAKSDLEDLAELTINRTF